MRDKRAGGIVAAVTLTIFAAFVVITVLFFNTSVSVAALYAESSTDLYSAELVVDMDSALRSQFTIVASSLLDDELIGFLQTEKRDDPTTAAIELRPLLEELLVDKTECTSFVASVASGNVYLSNGTYMSFDKDELVRDWHHANLSDSGRGQDQTYSTKYVFNDDGTAIMLAGRALSKDGRIVGWVGIGISSSTIATYMRDFEGTNGVEATLYRSDGRVIASTLDDVASGIDVFSIIPEAAALQDEASNEKTTTQKMWVSLDGPLPRGQVLYEIRTCRDVGADLLVVNPAEGIFSNMRARVSTLVLALCVVMVLLLLMVMFIVRWYRRRLIEVATTDELTGLANRKSFVASFDELTANGMGVAHLALIDVDKFKAINDTYGHAAGDHALATVAEEVRRMVGADGICGRWGGDEFIALMRLPQQEAAQRAKAMISTIAKRDVDDLFNVSVSVGLAPIKERMPLEGAVERADDALYVTKEGGRGFLAEYVEGVTPHMSNELAVVGQKKHVERPEASHADMNVQREGLPVFTTTRFQDLLDLVVASLLEAVHKMVPFVAGGGILIAIAFLVDGASVDINTLTAESRANFGSITPIATGLRDVGSAAFNFMLPIFAAFLARGLAGDEAFMAGFAGGYLSSQGSAGFAGAIAAAVVAAIVVNLMRGLIRDTAKSLQHVAPVLIYPVFSLLIMYLLMAFVIDPVATAFDAWLTSILETLSSGSRVLLGAACGAFMATDMGGPINKAAYHFGTASIASGSYDIMASVMVGGMVPPCGIALSMILFRNKFTDAERDQIAPTLFMGLSFITEGAIPFLLTDILRVIPSCMLGSAVAGGLSMLMGCTLMAPHGGIFVFPVVGNPGLYLASLIAGSLVTAVVLGLLKKDVGS